VQRIEDRFALWRERVRLEIAVLLAVVALEQALIGERFERAGDAGFVAELEASAGGEAFELEPVARQCRGDSQETVRHRTCQKGEVRRLGYLDFTRR